MLLKKTRILSRVDNIIKELKKHSIPFNLSLLGTTKGAGLNDYEFSRPYIIRRLEFQNYVILEKYVYSKDTHVDDYIISKVFYKETEPKNWKFKIKR